MEDFYVGDYVEVLMKDGAVFQGILMDFQPEFVQINGFGFPVDDILVMRHC